MITTVLLNTGSSLNIK